MRRIGIVVRSRAAVCRIGISMPRISLRLVWVFLALALIQPCMAATGGQEPARDDASARALLTLKSDCFGCHNPQ